MKKIKCDFSGYATRANIECTDGRTIMPDAFKHNDGITVPLVWHHLHNEINNILGYAILEHREDGVYAYGVFNDTDAGITAKALVKHGDITAMSIYANKLTQKGLKVLHGAIKEVSLVFAGANPGATIENLSFEHAGISEEVVEEAIIYPSDEDVISMSDESDAEPETPEVPDVIHAEETSATVQEAFDAFTDEQKAIVYFMLAQAEESKKDLAQSDDTNTDPDTSPEQSEDLIHSEGGDTIMKKNLFDKTEDESDKTVLTHADTEAIFSDAKKCGSMKQAVLAHGITDIDWLFPEARMATPTPDFIKRNDAWVAQVWGALKKSAFSRIKSMAADITADEARARGYIKGKLKVEEVITLLKRSTTPQTVYKKQKLDRDDIIDIVDFDVVSWLKLEMRGMLDEELAVAVLVGDGRAAISDDKIKEENIRPIFTDSPVYTIHQTVEYPATPTVTQKANALIEAALRARKNYKGSGSPKLYVDPDSLVTMLLATDTLGRRLYDSEAALALALRVSGIVEVPAMEDKTRSVTVGEVTTVYKLLGLIVNLQDYTVGADKGGAVNMFDDFDIDYNQMKYLIEARCSGALTRPYSAISLEEVVE